MITKSVWLSGWYSMPRGWNGVSFAGEKLSFSGLVPSSAYLYRYIPVSGGDCGFTNVPLGKGQPVHCSMGGRSLHYCIPLIPAWVTADKGKSIGLIEVNVFTVPNDIFELNFKSAESVDSLEACRSIVVKSEKQVRSVIQK